MKELTKEQLLRNQVDKEFVKHTTSKYGDTTRVFTIKDKEDCVNLRFKTVHHKGGFIDEEVEEVVEIKVKGNTEEYPVNTEYLTNRKSEVFKFRHELALNYYNVRKIFDNGVKVDEEDYQPVIVPFEFREAVTMKLYKVVSSEDLEKILKEGILPISKTGNDNWDNDGRANNSTEVVYLFNPLTDKKDFKQYGDVLLTVETTAYKNELEPNDVNNGKYEEYITFEVKPEEIINVEVIND